MEEKEEQEKKAKKEQQQLTMTRATASESTTDRDSTYLYEQVGENEENTIENNDNATNRNNNNYKDRNRTQESDYQNYIFESQASDNIFGESTSNQAMYQNVYNDDKNGEEEEEKALQ